ncbi:MULTISPECIES: hypothetical protein [Xenorhabdus]|uniref:hypothetical protein n=1 Tax=Xenorhabdus TaxID=626 RepID=UPI00064A36B2|nr:MULTISPECIES: hypothetical protein [Xenorhabdus]KLU14704.1 hypothetical protein AAY47_14835 [Xenorhabdus griffiniae]KOP31661.1 hypothetical protein AFK69_19715 [Xenorhabdus sp. GDc328]
MEKRIEELEKKVEGLEKQLTEFQGAVSHYYAIHQIAIDEIRAKKQSAKVIDAGMIIGAELRQSA